MKSSTNTVELNKSLKIKIPVSIPKKSRQPWKKEEDECVLYLSSKYNKDWKLVSIYLTSLNVDFVRSPEECKSRYETLVGNDIWNKEDDTILMLKHIEYGSNWIKIKEFLPKFSVDSIQERFKFKLLSFIENLVSNLIKNKEIDPKSMRKCTKLSRVIRRNHIPLHKLNSEYILEMLKNDDKYLSEKGNKNESMLSVSISDKSTRINSEKSKVSLSDDCHSVITREENICIESSLLLSNKPESNGLETEEFNRFINTNLKVENCSFNKNFEIENNDFSSLALFQSDDNHEEINYTQDDQFFLN